MELSAEGLPEGLKLDPATGRITGSLKDKGEHVVTLRAKNALGEFIESGFEVIQNSTEPSFLYRVLRMMEAEGLLASKLDPTGSGPARKVYELTGEGQEVLSMWVAKLEEMCAFFTSFGRRYAALSRAEGRSQ